MPSEEATKLIETSKAKLDAPGSKKTDGDEVFNTIQSSTLTPEEKQEVFQELGKHVVSKGLSEATNPATLLRESNAGTNFMTAYMNEYAKEYLDSVYQDVENTVKSSKFPVDPNMTTLPKPGETGELYNLKPETCKTTDGLYTDMSKVLIQSSEEHMPKISPEAKAFLKGCSDQIRQENKPEALSTFMASTVMLRAVSPKVFNEGAKLRGSGDPESKRQGELMHNGLVVVQSYSNTLDKVGTVATPESKPHMKVVEGLRTPERMDQSRKLMDSLSKGEDVSLGRQNAAKPIQAEISKMEAKLDKLNKPSLWDRIKAIPDGGIAKQKEKLIEKLDEAKMNLHRTVAPEDFQKVGEQEKRNIQELKNIQGTKIEGAIEHDMAKMDLKGLQVKAGLEKSGIYSGMETQEELQQQIGEKQEVLKKTGMDAKEFDMMDKDVKALEKNQSVRESLGKTLGKAPETPKTGVSVK